MTQAARVGDDCVCTIHGPNKIISGSPTTKLAKQKAARVGDKTACGASILPNASCVQIDGENAARLGDLISHGGNIISGAESISFADGNTTLIMSRIEIVRDFHVAPGSSAGFFGEAPKKVETKE